jgi:ABC-type glycerol-3-phosphate transport system substrate-binding protein
MRRALAVISMAGILGLAACSSGSGGGAGTSGDTSSTTPVTIPGGAIKGGDSITDPIVKARSVVGQQNAQLQQEEQRTGSGDPTSP